MWGQLLKLGLVFLFLTGFEERDVQFKIAGIFKWSSFFFAVRVRPPAQRPEIQRSSMDVGNTIDYS